MSDPLASAECTLEDLLCHRSGLGPYNDMVRYEKLGDVVGSAQFLSLWAHLPGGLYSASQTRRHVSRTLRL